MKFSKKQWINGVFIIGILLILFTPVGFHARVFVSRLLATSAAVLKTELQVPVENYNWQLTDVNGTNFNFADAKGKVVLINFWATWCPPCVAEMPSLQKLYSDYSDKVIFMFVAQDKVKAVSAFMAKKEYTFPVFYSKTKAPGVLSSKTIPTTYVINKEGKISIAKTGVANWNSEKTRAVLDRLLAE